ncbi:MAG: HAMP domain-containing protein [Actinobacteria bacterium]|nr:HAMP domain-containing protein [Actinomycetota bacterium]
MPRLRLTRTLSIRTRLLLYFVCVVVLTAGAISGMTAVIESREAHQRVVAQLRSVVTLKEQQITSWASGLRLSLDVVLLEEGITTDLMTLTGGTATATERKAAYERVRSRFVWVAERAGLFEEVFFMDPAGRVLVSTDRGHERQQLGMNEFFIEGLRAEFIQEPSYSLSLGKMTVVASRPVLKGGLSTGVIAGRASLESLNDVMAARAGLGETGETYLVGSNHRLLTDLRQDGYEIPNTYIRTEGADAAVASHRGGSATYTGYAGRTVVGVYEWIPRLKVALMAEQEKAEALAATRLALWTTGGIAIAATVLAILIGTVLIHGIVRPLSELGETAGRIADGELELDAPVRHDDEIGKLARAFNRMTARLRGSVVSAERQADHLRAINEAGRRISSILDLDELLPPVARSLLRAFDYSRVRILLLDGEESGRLLSCARDGEDVVCGVRLDGLADDGPLPDVVRSGERVVRGGDGHSGPGPAWTEAAVPIRVGQTVAGVLEVTAADVRPLDEQDVSTVEALADQLAVAVANARLYQQAQELAATRERQRLARDLHDAVSQTLFSVSIIAEVLPRIYQKDPGQARERLEELRQLTRGALAEMRMLLLELRPAALAGSTLPDLLTQLGEAVTGRARIPIVVDLGATPTAPPEVNVALYRIAQEALNNVAKHSGAESAEVLLRGRPAGGADRPATGDAGGADGLELVVRDDGCGFDVDDPAAGRLGLTIMAERAASISARLEITSAAGEGTCVRVVWGEARA